MAIPPRRSQAQRSHATKLALMEATMRLLLDRGYTRFTTSEAAEAAGVSRGALTHHFASKEDLVVEAVAHDLAKATARLSAHLAAGGTSPDLDGVVDYLWGMMSGGLFYTVLEYLPEARHNEGFRQRLLPATREFHAALDALWHALAWAHGIDPARAGTTLNATLCLMRGMVAQTVLRPDAPYYDAMLAHWKEHLRSVFGDRGAAVPHLEMQRGRTRKHA